MSTPERKKVGSMKLRKGHTLYRYSKSKNTLNAVTFTKPTDQEEAEMKAKGMRMKKQIDVTEDDIYIGALNFKNAVKKLLNHYKINVENIKQ